VYPASLVLLAAAAVTLAMGLQREGLTLILVSIACSGLATVSVLLGVLRRLRRR
jgi:hypothetical protein